MVSVGSRAPLRKPGGTHTTGSSPIAELTPDRSYYVDLPTGQVFWLEDDALVQVQIERDETVLLAARAVVDFDGIEPDRAARDREIQAVLLEREGETHRAALAQDLAAEKLRQADFETELSAFAFPDGAPGVREYLSD